MRKYFFILLFAFILLGFKNAMAKQSEIIPYIAENSVKSKALTVLEQKCNDCHLKKYKSIIFTEKNMDVLAKSIHIQVFVKKKMPKGKVKLTDLESESLRAWLTSIGIQ